MKQITPVLIGLLCIITTQSLVHAQPLPNVVVIDFDDTCWTGFGCFGGDVDTPQVDRLASEGMRFTE